MNLIETLIASFLLTITLSQSLSSSYALVQHRNSAIRQGEEISTLRELKVKISAEPELTNKNLLKSLSEKNPKLTNLECEKVEAAHLCFNCVLIFMSRESKEINKHLSFCKML